MSVRYVGLVDYVAIAVEVTGLDGETVAKVADLRLADSALHAPAAEFGDTEFYPDFVDKAAVRVVRLTKNTRCPTAASAPLGWRFGSSSRPVATAAAAKRDALTGPPLQDLTRLPSRPLRRAQLR